jgi:hypothetical protein
VLSETTHCRYTGAFFTKAKHFIVAGGKFKSVTHVHQAAPCASPGTQGSIIPAISMKAYPRWTEFPVIPLGHINLLCKIERDGGSGVVRRKYGQNSVRRIYSAWIHGCQSNMAVALYQGDGAENVRFQFF